MLRGSLLKADDGAWADTPTPQGSTFHSLRRCKGPGDFTELKWKFSPHTDFFSFLCVSVSIVQQMYQEWCSIGFSPEQAYERVTAVLGANSIESFVDRKSVV